MRRRCRAFAWAIATLLGLFSNIFAQPAQAYEEQVSADLALGYAGVLASDLLPSQLPSIDLGASLGISDWLVLRAALGYAAFLEQGQDARHAGRGRVELAYLIDIVQWVPFFGLGTGLWIIGDPGGGVVLRGAGHAIFGMDYLATRAWTVGVDVRVGFLWGSGELSNFTEGQLRLSRMFDLF